MGLKRGERYPAAPLAEADVKRLMRQFNKNQDGGCRDLAILVVMIGTGMRISEVLALKMEDLRQHEELIHVRHGKGDKSRFVSVHQGVWAVLGRWLTRRKKHNFPDGTHVFCTIPRWDEPGGRPIHRENHSKEFYKRVKRAGLKGRVHPHQMRHTFAYELAKGGVQPHIIQKQLGHSSLDMTSRYIAHLCPTEVKVAVNRRVWAYG